MENKKQIYTTCIPIRWGDMDALGHVNSTVYFRYMEQARVEWIQQIALNPPTRHGFVLLNAQCHFLRQLKYPGTVEVKTYILGSLGRSSFDTSYEIYRTDLPEMLVAEGKAKVVWVDFDQEKSIPLPDVLRQQLNRCMLQA